MPMGERAGERGASELAVRSYEALSPTEWETPWEIHAKKQHTAGTL